MIEDKRNQFVFLNCFNSQVASSDPKKEKHGNKRNLKGERQGEGEREKKREREIKGERQIALDKDESNNKTNLIHLILSK